MGTGFQQKEEKKNQIYHCRVINKFLRHQLRLSVFEEYIKG